MEELGEEKLANWHMQKNYMAQSSWRSIVGNPIVEIPHSGNYY